MAEIRVGRGTFWAGVLVLVATIALSAVFGQQSNPPYGTGWDFLPLGVIVGLMLLLASVAVGGSPNPGAGEPRADPSPGPR